MCLTADCASTNTPAVPAFGPDVIEDLTHYLKCWKRDIQDIYALFVSCVHDKVVADREVSASNLCFMLLNLSALQCEDSSKHSKLFYEVRKKFCEAESVDAIFCLLSEYTSFLDYDIYLRIANKYKIDIKQEKSEYLKHLSDYVNKHRISELVQLLPTLSNYTEKMADVSKTLVFKLNIKLSCKLADLIELKSAIARVLGFNPTALRLVGVNEGSVLVTFLVPALAADLVFVQGKIVTPQTREELFALSVLSIEYDGRAIVDFEAEKLSYEKTLELSFPDKRTPLHYACQHGRVDVAERLITNHLCSIESKDVQGCTPLHIAAQYGHVETLKYLLHRLFNHEVSGLTIKLTPGGKLSHTLISKFQQKLSDRHRDQSGNTPLHTACVHGQMDVVQLITREIGCDPNNTNFEGLSCLHLATQHGHLPLVRYLVEEVGSDVTFEDEHGRSPTYLAAEGGHLNILKYLIEEKGADPKFSTSKEWNAAQFSMALGRSLIHSASREGHLHLVRYLVEHHGCDPSCKDNEGITPLHLACQEGYVDIVSYLITEAHCDPNCISEDGQTCLHFASLGGWFDVIKYLHIKHNCQVKPDSDGWTPLHYAVVEGSVAVSIYLIEIGCDPNNANNEGLSCLHLAAQHGHLPLVRYLVEKMGSDFLAKHGKFLACLAAERGHLNILKFMIKQIGADPNFMASRERQITLASLLHLASREGHLHVLRYLVEHHGCDPSCKDDEGITPLYLASKEGHMDIVSYLITEAHCDPNCISEDGRTCLHAASIGGKLNVIKYLLVEHNCQIRPDYNGYTPLHYAAAEGNLDVLIHLIEICFDPNSSNEGMSYLRLATQRGHLPLVRYLVEEMGSDVTLEDKHGRSLTYLAAEGGHLDILKYLIEEKRADSQFKTSKEWNATRFTMAPGRSLVHTASREGHLHVVRYLVEHHGCDPSCKDDEGITPLYLACQEGHMDIVSYLITEAHCDPNCISEDGQTCLHVASLGGWLDVIKYLHIKHNCHVKPDSDGWTPLHYAAVEGSVDISIYLIKIGCDLNHMNSEGLSCLHLAAQHNHLPLVKYLMESITNPIFAKSLTYLAAQGGHIHILKFLIPANPQYLTSMEWKITLASLLRIASREGHLCVVRYLVEDHGCDPSCKDDEGITPLYFACQEGHMDIVSYLITEAHCDPNCTSKDGRTCLHAASIGNRLDVSKYLHRNKSCQIVPDSHGKTPLHYAAAGGHVDVLMYLIEHMKCDPNSRDPYERTPLHYASGRGQLDAVKYLAGTHHFHPLPWPSASGQLEPPGYFSSTLKHVLLSDKFNNSPLHFAAAFGHLDVVKFLTEDMKCDSNLKGRYGRTPLHYASENGHLEVVKYLVDTLHCDPLCAGKKKQTPLHLAVAITHLMVKDKFSNTPLHLAALYGHLEVVKFLTEDMKCDPNLKGQLWTTPLHYACERGHLDVIMYLVDTHHCDPLCPDENRQTPLHLVAAKGQIEVARYFGITKKSNFIVEDNFTNTPLHYAALCGHLELVKFLTEDMKCDPNLKGQHENTPLHYASRNGHLDVVKHLVGISGDPLRKNKKGLTAEDLASQNGHRHLVSFLLRATSNKTVVQKDVLSPPLTIFVVGNSKSGKSTLVKALSAENIFFGRRIKVKGVAPLTAGIVPTNFHSQLYGKTNIYDFAGHEEYYASHEMILCQTSQPVVLLVVDMSLSEQHVRKQVSYWLMILSNCCYGHASMTMHVIIVGSHADRFKSREKQRKSREMKELMHQLMTSLGSSASFLKYYGSIWCDCRYSISDDLNQLRQKLNNIYKSIRLFFAQESYDSNTLCAALMCYLERIKSEHAIITLNELFQVIPQHSNLAAFSDKELLFEISTHLSSCGHLLFFHHGKNKFNSMLVLNQAIVLPKFHSWFNATIGRKRIEDSDQDIMGIYEGSKLRRVLSDLLDNITDSELAVKYLIFTQFCTEVSANQLISPQGITADRPTFYVFPNLVNASQPSDLLMGTDNYTHLYTWGLKCTNDHQFFTPRFLHTLLVQLTKYERNTNNAKFRIWKSGIFILQNNGTVSVVEMTDQSTRLYLTMQCVKGSQPHFLRQRCTMINLIRSLASKVCPVVETEEILLCPKASLTFANCEEILIVDVKQAIQSGQKSVRTKGNGDHVSLKKVLYLDALQLTKDQTLRELFSRCQSDNRVSLSALSSYCKSSELYREFAELFENIEGQLQDLRDITYSELRKELMNYSILTDEYVSSQTH